MTTHTATYKVTIAPVIVLVLLVFILLTTISNMTIDASPTASIDRQTSGINGSDGAWERTYLFDGVAAPALPRTTVNASIEMLASHNAAAAANVRPGENVDGVRERMMFGLQ